MNKVIISFIFLFIITLKVNAQTSSNIRTIDLMFLPLSYIEGQNDGSIGESLLTVKIEKIDSVNQVDFFLGTLSNPDKILHIKADVIKTDEKTFIKYKGILWPFDNYTCSIKVKLSRKDYDKIESVKFYLTDKLNKKSDALYFNIN